MTDEEITAIWKALPNYTLGTLPVISFARAIIAASDEELRKQGGATVFSDKTMYAAPMPPTGGTIKDECNADCFYECDHHCPPCPLAAPISPEVTK